MKYGSVPVVRSVGGLFDTVIDEADLLRKSFATGFQFKEQVTNPSERLAEQPAANKLVLTLQRALEIYTKNQQRWYELMINGMRLDSSWQVPSMQYVKLYHDAVRRRVQSSFFGG